MHVDYKNKTFFDVCKEFIKLTIRSSNSLDMLCRPRAPAKGDLKGDADNLPSWICRLDKSPFRPRTDGNYGRVNADLLVGLPDSGGRIYAASAMTRPADCAMGKTKEKAQSLYVSGFVLDEIGELRVQAIEGNVPNEWLEISGWTDLTMSPPDSFWRAVVADRDDRGHNPPWYYRRACQHAFAQRVMGGSLNTASLIASEPSKIMRDYLKRVQSVIWNRRLMKTKKDERLGLVPHDARVGDKVCILRGCSVPIVLRKVVEKGAQASRVVTFEEADVSPLTSRQSVASTTSHHESIVNGEPNHTDRTPIDAESPTHGRDMKMKSKIPLKCTLIGECYIHGVMDGEAFRIRDREDLPDVDFEFV